MGVRTDVFLAVPLDLEFFYLTISVIGTKTNPNGWTFRFLNS